jgi:two-component system response regulator (stage 0 sporulation protein A)
MDVRRIHVLCAMRDSRVVEGLRKRFYERCLFRAVGSGDAALYSAQRVPPDILVVDAVLPKLDGIGVVERIGQILGEMRMPVVIGGSVLSFSDEAFSRLGVRYLASVPWSESQLCALLTQIIRQMDTRADWTQAKSGCMQAQALLKQMGMNESLRGFTYLSWAAAIAAMQEERLGAVREKLYVPVAERFDTTPQCVERLIRHAVERTADSVGARGIYTFFGNTIDPMRGKPTNAQMLAMLAERVRIS